LTGPKKTGNGCGIRKRNTPIKLRNRRYVETQT
jgi:hypothetical protein